MNTTSLEGYLKLQNGSDIRGVAIDGMPGEEIDLDTDAGRNIGKAFARWLRNKYYENDSSFSAALCRDGSSFNSGFSACCDASADADPSLCRDFNQSPENFTLTVSVGRDPRLSGDTLAEALIEGLISEGANVLNCGLASTPAMFMSTVFDSFDCDGAVMITASHLPFNRNGFKFFDKNGGLNKDNIKTILSIAAAIADGRVDSSGDGNADGHVDGSVDEHADNSTDNHVDKHAADHPGKTTNDVKGRLLRNPSTDGDLMNRYCRHLREIICHGVGADICDNDPNLSDSDPADCSLPLAGLKIVVDAGNGSGGFYADKVLRPLGADVVGCYLEPDGSFPNHIPNPENKEAMASICSAVKKTGADLGIIFDTDVDRSAAVDENGHEISRNGIVALAAALIAEKHPGTTVVTDSITSDQLAVFLEQDLGMRHLRFKRGYKNVINKAIELNKAGEECHLAIETSGHAAIRDNHFLDDGAYLATLIVIKAAKLAAEGKRISSLITSLEEPADAIEVRMKIGGDDFVAVADMILAELEEWIRGCSCADKVCDCTGSNDGGSTGSGNGGESAGITDPSDPTDDSSYFELVEPNYEGVRARFNSKGFGRDEYVGLAKKTDTASKIDKDCISTITGVSASAEVTGWFLLRKSLHDPIMPLNIESDQEGGCAIIASKLKDFLARYKELDSSDL